MLYMHNLSFVIHKSLFIQLDITHNVLFFATAREARKEMVGHLYAEAHGFEVHEMGNDV